jgi:HD-GYP domain-containing protein (c-di-GMP phosphodiesterase class II)
VSPVLPLAFGVATTGVLVAHERRERQHSERLAAALLETLLNAVDANDPQTGAHVRRVARVALVLADAADLDEPNQRSVERVALFHDIGKIHEALFDIIHDDTKLSAEDRRAIATHPARGADVLRPLEAFYPDLCDGVLSHHERWDGKGYPRCLAGEDIPLAARIVAIADTYDAVTHSRRYHRGQGALAAADVIARGAGTQFDPDLAALFLFPAVFQCVLAATRPAAQRETARASRSHGGDRRDGKPKPAPDITFRWRDPVREREAGDAAAS